MLTPNSDMAADRGGERGRQVSVNQLLIWNRQLAPLPDSQSAAGHGLSRNIPVGKCAPPPPPPHRFRRLQACGLTARPASFPSSRPSLTLPASPSLPLSLARWASVRPGPSPHPLTRTHPTNTHFSSPPTCPIHP